MIDKYNQLVSSGHIIYDDWQVEVINQLAIIKESVLQEMNYKRSLFTRFKRNNVRGMYLVGSVGRGKSMLMNMFAEDISDYSMRVHLSEFLPKFRKILGNDDITNGVKRYLQSYNNPKIFLLDELFLKDPVNAIMIGNIFDELIKRGIFLVISSNFMPENLYNGVQKERFLPTIDLINNNLCVMCQENGIDYRMEAKIDGKFSIINNPYDDLHAINYIIGKYNCEKSVAGVEVYDRAIDIDRYDGDKSIAVFHYEDLHKNYGVDDMFAIVSSVDIIIICGMKQMGVYEENEARRFIHLIDAIYEKQKELYVNSYVEMNDIYNGTKLKDEIKRAESRIYELT